MITIIRRHQRYLMLVIAILTIIAFAWLYNPTPTPVTSNIVAEVYGKKLTQADIDREVRNFRLAMSMGQYGLLGDLGGMASSEQQMLEEFVWNLRVLKHEAQKLGVQPTDQQVATLLKGLPVFQTDGQYDPQKYTFFVQEQLGPLGFTEEQVADVAKDSIRLERIKDIVSAPVTVSEDEIVDALRVSQAMDLQILKFPVPDASGITVSQEELQAFYDKSKAGLIAPETRTVKFVEFSLPAEQSSLTGKEKIEALQKVADNAAAFSSTVENSSFDQAAGEAKLTISETPAFNRSGVPQGVAPQNLDLTKIAPTTFLLTEENSVSDVVQSGDHFYVLKLGQITPERQMTLEETKELLESAVRSEKAAQQAKEKAEAALAKIREAVSAGRPIAEVAAAEGVEVQTVVGLVPTEAQPNQVPLRAVRLSLIMEPGQLSGLVPSESGPVAVFVTARAPLALPEDKLATEKTALKQQIMESKQRMLFMTWLASARTEANVIVNSGSR